MTRLETLLARLRCVFVGHAFGAPRWTGRVVHVRCAECGYISDGWIVPRTVLRKRS